MYGIGPGHAQEPMPLLIQEISNGFIVKLPPELLKPQLPFDGLAKELKTITADQAIENYQPMEIEDYEDPDCNIYVFHDYKAMMEFITEYYAKTAFEGKEE